MSHKKSPERSLIIHEAGPVYSKDSRVLILGTMPSPKSRQTGFYYAHSQNRFWKVMAALFCVPEPKTTDEKKELILKNRLALYDVLYSCEISGASDSTIKNPVPSDLSPILKGSAVAHIVTTGQKAHDLYMKYHYEKTRILPVGLPSTSPQNFKYSLPDLILEYTVIKELLKG